jgi:hypothetical protein
LLTPAYVVSDPEALLLFVTMSQNGQIWREGQTRQANF